MGHLPGRIGFCLMANGSKPGERTDDWSVDWEFSNQSVTNGWDEGDFNYDGKVNGNDFVLLAANFNQFASQSAVSAADQSALDSFAAANGINITSVPEPTSATIFLITAMGLLQPRFRSKKRDLK
jgi:hypothetical protein